MARGIAVHIKRFVHDYKSEKEMSHTYTGLVFLTGKVTERCSGQTEEQTMQRS